MFQYPDTVESIPCIHGLVLYMTWDISTCHISLTIAKSIFLIRSIYFHVI